MASPREASPIRVALIDDDSGLVTVLDRRFAALHWDRKVLSYAPGPDQLAGMRLHALIVNPALTGLDYLERIALALPGLAVLVCTGPTPVAERVRGLRCGADDWLTKPCHPEELIARVQAVMRRRRAGETPSDDEPIEAGEIAIRPDRFDAYVRDEPASLSRKEYELLRQLAVADGRVLEREEIYQRVWGYTMVRGDRSVDVFVRKLRQKLERVSPDWRYVHTHFGVGYRFAAERVDSAGPAAAAPAENAAAESGAAERAAAEIVAANPPAEAQPDRAELGPSPASGDQDHPPRTGAGASPRTRPTAPRRADADLVALR
jgi:DNA-binding response OmpR family regulator